MINVRSNPGIKSKSKGYLLDSTSLHIIHRTKVKDTISNMSYYWYYCGFGIDKYGWIYGKYVETNKDKRKKTSINDHYPENYPKEFDTVSGYNWSDIPLSKRGKGDRGGGDVAVSIRSNFFINEFDYIIEPKYKIVNIALIKKNKFSLTLQLIAVDNIISKNDIVPFEVIINYMPKDDTISIIGKNFGWKKLYRHSKVTD